MPTGPRTVLTETFADAAVDMTVSPVGSYKLIEVVFLLETSASTSESATIKLIDASANEFDQITADEGNFSTNDMDKTQIFRFDKEFEKGSSIQIDYANTADHCDDIVCRVVYQEDGTV